MQRRILCVGEILFDVYSDYKCLGGTPFNFAYHLHQLGQQVAFVSRIGKDPYGQEIIAELQSQKIATDFIQMDTEHETGTVAVKLDDKGIPNFAICNEVAYDFIEPNQEISSFVEQGVDLIYIGTLALRNAVTRKTIRSILAIVPEKTHVFYDINLRQSFYTKEIIAKSLHQSDIVKLNEDEFIVLQKLFAIDSQNAEKKLAKNI